MAEKNVKTTEKVVIRPPKEIPARSRWRKTRSEVIDRLDEVSRLKIELVDRMILNLIEAEAVLREAAADPIQTGPRGQLVEHPGFRIAARCETTAVSIATKLGVLELVKPATNENETEVKPVERVEDELAAIRKRKASG